MISVEVKTVKPDRAEEPHTTSAELEVGTEQPQGIRDIESDISLTETATEQHFVTTESSTKTTKVHVTPSPEHVDVTSEKLIASGKSCRNRKKTVLCILSHSQK